MLTPEAIVERRRGIGGSDARKIVDGDWHTLWLEKLGKVEPPDLSAVWPVQLGVCTETLNLDWYARKFERPVTRRGEAVICKAEPILRVTLDGWDVETVIEAKHVNAFSKIGDVRERYAPQVMHEMLVTDAAKGVLSVIIGAAEPVYELFDRDEFWEISYIEQCREFWGYVMRNEPPEKGAPMSIAPAVPPALMRTVDMSGSNSWTNHAGNWLDNRTQAKIYEAATKEIKALMEPDMREAFGAGIVCSRSKSGALTIKEKK